MKKVLSILLAVVFFISSTGFSIITHHCGGRIHKQEISLVAEGINCGMEKVVEEPCEDNTISDNCCQNEFQIFKVTDDYQSSVKGVHFNASFLFAFAIFYIELLENETTEEDFFADHSPPLLIKDIPILIQSFLI